MSQHGVLVHCEEAMRFIEQIDDPVTKNLVNMAFVHFVKTTNLTQSQYPSSDFDMVYLVTTLKEFFAEHQVLGETLNGEKVGTWFDDNV